MTFPPENRASCDYSSRMIANSNSRSGTITGGWSVGKALNAMVPKARIGERGDGKIFVSPVDDAIKVRTEDEGESAI